MRVFRVLWPLISLPMMLSFCYVYNTTRSFGSTMWRSAAKCGATFVAVITAVLGIVLFNRPANAWLLALALLFCCIADFVIERDFRFGVISFGLAHLVLIGYIAQLGYNALHRRETVTLDDGLAETLGELAEFDRATTEAADLIGALVAAMSPPDRDIFLRKYYLLQSGKEIAAALGMSVESVNTRLSRGRDRLRRELTEKGVYSHA